MLFYFADPVINAGVVNKAKNNYGAIPIMINILAEMGIFLNNTTKFNGL
jgi:hypothetical protein